MPFPLVDVASHRRPAASWDTTEDTSPKKMPTGSLRRRKSCLPAIHKDSAPRSPAKVPTTSSRSKLQVHHRRERAQTLEDHQYGPEYKMWLTYQREFGAKEAGPWELSIPVVEEEESPDGE